MKISGPKPPSLENPRPDSPADPPQPKAPPPKARPLSSPDTFDVPLGEPSRNPRQPSSAGVGALQKRLQQDGFDTPSMAITLDGPGTLSVGGSPGQPTVSFEPRGPAQPAATTPEQVAAAASSDARQVEAALRSSPAAGAQKLHELMQGSEDPRYRDALIQQSSAFITEMGRQGALDKEKPGSETSRTTLDQLSRVAELASPEGRRAMAEAFIRQVPDGQPLGERLQPVLQAGGGATLAVELSAALNRAGQSNAAQGVAQTVARTLQDAQQEFKKRADEVDEFNGELGELMANFSPAMTPEQLGHAIQSFKDQHKDAYQACEASAARLAPLLAGAEDARSNPDLPPPVDPVEPPEFGHATGPRPLPPDLRLAAGDVVEEAPRILESEAGQQKVTDALKAQTNGQRTFLDALPGVVPATAKGQSLLKHVSNTIVKAMGGQVLSAMAAGDKARAQKLLDGLAKNAPLFGVDPAKMESVSGSMKEVLAGTPGAQEKLTTELRKLGGGTPGVPNGSPGAQGLKALSLAVSAAGAADSWKGFSQAQLKDQIKTIGDSLQLGGDGGSLALQVMGRGAQPLATLLEKTSAVGSVISAFTDGIKAIQGFAKGDWEQGLVSSASAVGGTLVAAATLMEVPVVGQIAGALLSAGGLIGNLILQGREDWRKHDDAKAFLKGAGLNDAAADKLAGLRAHGPFIAELAPALNTTPEKLLSYVAGLDGEQLAAFTTMALHVPQHEQDGQKHFAQTAPDDERFQQEKDPVDFIDSDIAHRPPQKQRVWPSSINGVAQWMRSHGMTPAA